MLNSSWHERASRLEDERYFKKLLSLHALTHQWTEALNQPEEDAALKIERMPQVRLKQNLWLLEKTRLDQTLIELDALVHEQTVAEYLAELYEIIWIIQLSTLENAVAEASDEHLLINLLKNASWNYGKKVAETQWPELHAENLRQAYDAFLESHPDGTNGFLMAHAAKEELGFFWTRSPLRNPTVNESKQIENLCALHQEWISGFFYGISRKIKVSSKIADSDHGLWIEFTLLWTY